MDCVDCACEIVGYYIDKTAAVCERNHLTCLECDELNLRICKSCNGSTKYCEIEPYELKGLQFIIDLKKQFRPSLIYEREMAKKDKLKKDLEESERQASEIAKYRAKIPKKYGNFQENDESTSDNASVDVQENDESTSDNASEEPQELNFEPSSSKAGPFLNNNNNNNLSKISLSNEMEEEFTCANDLPQSSFDHNLNDGFEKPIELCKLNDIAIDSLENPQHNPYEKNVIPLNDLNTSRSANDLTLWIWHHYKQGNTNNQYLFSVSASKNDFRMKFILDRFELHQWLISRSMMKLNEEEKKED